LGSIDGIKDLGEIRVSIERGEQLKAVLQFPFIKGIYLDEGAFSEEELLKYRGEIQNSGKWAGLRFRRIQRRTKLNIFFLEHAEQLYFWGKLLAAIAFLLLSFALMAGQSYMPFLYNQF